MHYNTRRQAGLALITGSVEALLCTVGPAGLQASYVHCRVQDHSVYVYVPRSSDQLTNLEQTTDVILITPIWQLRGTGMIVGDKALQTIQVPPALMSDADYLGLAVVLIAPCQMHIDLVEKLHQHETIDFEPTVTGSIHTDE